MKNTLGPIKKGSKDGTKRPRRGKVRQQQIETKDNNTTTIYLTTNFKDTCKSSRKVRYFLR